MVCWSGLCRLDISRGRWPWKLDLPSASQHHVFSESSAAELLFPLPVLSNPGLAHPQPATPVQVRVLGMPGTSSQGDCDELLGLPGSACQQSIQSSRIDSSMCGTVFVDILLQKLQKTGRCKCHHAAARLQMMQRGSVYPSMPPVVPGIDAM